METVDYRNSILPGKTSDRDTGPNTTGHAAHEITKDYIERFVQGQTLQYQRLMKDMTFDYSHPVDEYAPTGNPGAQASLTVQPDYDMPEKIDHVTYVIPVGATSALLQLGSRTIQLYSGTALTAPIASALYVGGIILNADDPRSITFAGSVTSQPYLGLAGWALTRGQFS